MHVRLMRVDRDHYTNCPEAPDRQMADAQTADADEQQVTRTSSDTD